MIVKTLDEGLIQEIGHAFGYYDYGTEKGLVSVFSGPDRAAEYICGSARGMLRAAAKRRDAVDEFSGTCTFYQEYEKWGHGTAGAAR